MINKNPPALYYCTSLPLDPSVLCQVRYSDRCSVFSCLGIFHPGLRRLKLIVPHLQIMTNPARLDGRYH